jgi:hypothetical protein
MLWYGLSKQNLVTKKKISNQQKYANQKIKQNLRQLKLRKQLNKKVLLLNLPTT